jgi:ribonuclease D
MLNLAEVHHLPVENLLTPDYLRRLMWAPPETRDPAELADAVRAQLRAYGARPWQAELVTGALVGAILGAEVEPEE